MSLTAAVSGRKEDGRLDPLKCRDGSRPSVLLAEDSPAARVLTGALLNHIGCDVDVAEHGEEALSYIKNYDYDLVLMDIEMPVMDGVVAAREIRTMGGSAAATPIVALSAFLADTKKSSFWQEHFDVALSKPAGKHQLHATIRQVLDFNPANSKWLKVNNNDDEQKISEVVGELIEEEKLAKILRNICDADQVALLRTASAEISLYSGELALKHKRQINNETVRVLQKMCGISTTFAASKLHFMASGLSAEILAGTNENLEPRVIAVCDCADRTAEILQAKVPDFTGG